MAAGAVIISVVPVGTFAAYPAHFSGFRVAGGGSWARGRRGRRGEEEEEAERKNGLRRMSVLLLYLGKAV